MTRNYEIWQEVLAWLCKDWVPLDDYPICTVVVEKFSHDNPVEDERHLEDYFYSWEDEYEFYWTP